MCKFILFDFVHRLSNKITTFLKAGPGLGLAEPEGPADRLCILVPRFYLMMKAESMFRNGLIV